MAATIPADNPSADEVNLFARARDGDQAAWHELFDECYPKVRRVIRRRLGPLRQYVDSTDIASDVFGELARKSAGFRFDTIDEIKNFLIDAANKRIIDEYRRHHAQKRDSDRERPLDRGDSGVDAWTISSGVPTPSQFAVAQETDDRLRASTSDEAGRLVIALRGQHYNNEEISAQTGWSLRKVQRFLENLRRTVLN